MMKDSMVPLATRPRRSSDARFVTVERSLQAGWSGEAFDELKAIAARGEPAAQLRLGDIYDHAEGVNAPGVIHDPAAAREWYRRSAAQGESAAQLRLARLALQDPAAGGPGAAALVAAARAAQERAAEGGDAAAQAWLGDDCRLGLSVPKDAVAAKRWYRRAAAQGHVGALVALATLLEQPAGVSPAASAEAFSFWLSAGSAGDAAAQYEVGRHYRDGLGCEADARLAARWLRAAAAQSNAAAVKALAALERAGQVASQPNPSAVELFVAGLGHEHLREGWGDLGIADSWTVGTRARVELPVSGGGDRLLKLDVAGIFPPWGHGLQRIGVEVAGQPVGAVVCRGRAEYEFFVPAGVIGAQATVSIVLELPDARRPIDHGGGSDIRHLALRLGQLELVPIADEDRHPLAPSVELETQREALAHMQSLGTNCEFGFLQRALGVEPLGLLRWTLAPLAKLVPAIERGFAGLANPNALKIEMNDATEFVVEDTIYGFRHHSFVFASNGGTLEMVKRVEFLRVAMLSRSLLEEMRDRRKLFVYHDAGQSPLEEVRRLVTALGRHGANTLLWLVGPRADATVGEVRYLEPGLIRGVVSGFQLPVDQVVPVSPHRASWLSVATAAYQLWRGGNPGVER